MNVNKLKNNARVAIELIKSVKPRAWIAIASGFAFGVAGGFLLRQPEVNRLTEEANKAQTEVERLQNLVKSYHDQFVTVKASNEALKAKAFADNLKQEVEDERPLIMYQYAVKEYIEMRLRPCDEDGIRVFSENEAQFYRIFRRVIEGERLTDEEMKELQNFIYPKYKKEIKELIEFDFDELFKKLSAA